MVKNISPGDDFAHKFAGGMNQYGTKGADTSGDFNGYMNDGMTIQGTDNQSPTPMNIMSTPSNPAFGPPVTTQPGTLQGAAPENFGPPGVAGTSADTPPNFGPPNFEGDDSGLIGPGQGPGNQAGMSTFGAPPPGNGGNGVNLGAPPPSGDGNSTYDLDPGHGGGGTYDLDPDHKDGDKPEKKHTRAEVVNMMANHFIQGAINQMHIKHSDVWKE